MKRSMFVLMAVMLGGALFTQGCFTFRETDRKAIATFQKKGVELRTYYRKVGSRTIHYVQTGSDTLPTLVFVHGSPGSWTAFKPYLSDSQLLQQFRMISIDRPGFGYSDFGKAPDLATQSALLGPVIHSFRNGKPVRLIGHSLAGATVLQLALDYPGIADDLVVISGSIDPAAEKPEHWRGIVLNTPLNLLLPGAFRPSNRELWYLKNDLKQLAPRLPGLHRPVYFIHGRKDTWVPPSNVAFGIRELRGAPVLDTLWLEGGHFVPWTKFEEIRNFLLKR